MAGGKCSFNLSATFNPNGSSSNVVAGNSINNEITFPNACTYSYSINLYCKIR